jgi:hypothetical protein
MMIRSGVNLIFRMDRKYAHHLVINRRSGRLHRLRRRRGKPDPLSRLPLPDASKMLPRDNRGASNLRPISAMQGCGYPATRDTIEADGARC